MRKLQSRGPAGRRLVTRDVVLATRETLAAISARSPTTSNADRPGPAPRRGAPRVDQLTSSLELTASIRSYTGRVLELMVDPGNLVFRHPA
jgi:hypothetical protein